MKLSEHGEHLTLFFKKLIRLGRFSATKKLVQNLTQIFDNISSFSEYLRGLWPDFQVLRLVTCRCSKSRRPVCSELMDFLLETTIYICTVKSSQTPTILSDVASVYCGGELSLEGPKCLANSWRTFRTVKSSGDSSTSSEESSSFGKNFLTAEFRIVKLGFVITVCVILGSHGAFL